MYLNIFVTDFSGIIVLIPRSSSHSRQELCFPLQEFSLETELGANSFICSRLEGNLTCIPITLDEFLMVTGKLI